MDFIGGWKKKSAMLAEGMRGLAKDAGSPVRTARVGSMFCLFFSQGEVYDWTTAAACDTVRFSRYFRAMLEHGVYLAPSQFETAFVSIAHSDEDIEKTLSAAREALKF